jgi:hypothetical protein
MIWAILGIGAFVFVVLSAMGSRKHDDELENASPVASQVPPPV